MSRVLFTSARQDGFMLPLLRIARVMVERGDEVWFLSGAGFRERIEAIGATYVALPYDEELPAVRLDPDGERSGARGIAATLRALFLDTVEADHRAVLALHDRLRLDLVVTEPLFVGAGAVALLPRERRPAVLTVGLFPLPLSSPDVAPYGSGLHPIDGPLNRVRNLALAAAAEMAVVGPVRRAFASRVEDLTGVRPTGSLFDLAAMSDAYAQTSVPQFEYPRRTLPAKVRFVGPLPAPDVGGLPAWWDYRERRPIVHVTQGTFANDDPGELIVPTIRALAEEDLLVVATTGGPDPSTVTAAYGGPLPRNARVERFMPYDHLLRAARVMVTNGGFGAVHHAMRHGLPLVVAGTTEDKVEVNARVAWSGVGIDLGVQRPEPGRVREAVLRVLDEHLAYRRAGARMAAAIAGTDGIAGVLAMGDELVRSRAEA